MTHRTMESPEGSYSFPDLSVLGTPIDTTYLIEECHAIQPQMLEASERFYYSRARELLACRVTLLHDFARSGLRETSSNVFRNVVFGRFISSFTRDDGTPAMDNWYARFQWVFETYRIFVRSDAFIVQSFTPDDPTLAVKEVALERP